MLTSITVSLESVESLNLLPWDTANTKQLYHLNSLNIYRKILVITVTILGIYQDRSVFSLELIEYV